MAKMLEALLRLQSIENQLGEVRRRLKAKNAAVGAQMARVESLKKEHEGLRAETLNCQKQAGGIELELRTREQEVAKLRQALNTTKTNKEYAAILTQMNTVKADSSKLEDEALKLMQGVDQVQARAREVQEKIAQAQQYCQEVQSTNQDEVARLEEMVRQLTARRDEAARDVPPDALAVFNRVAATREGEAMAKVEIVGRRSPHEYVCSGCNMSIRAEHANALRTRDQIRFCDNCGRILYLEDTGALLEQ